MLLLLTIGSMAVALAMSVVAWRATSAERRRSDARVAALAAEIHQSIDLDLRGEIVAAPVATPIHAQDLFAPADTPTRGQDLFAPAAVTATGGRWGLALAAGGLVIASLAAGMIVFTGESPTASARPVVARDAQASPLPLELVALAHERAGESLTVRGVIRNPPSSVEMDRLVAVVFLFNRDGGFITSGRAAVESQALIPGGESTFTVTLPASSDVGRYRVSFRSDDRVISHVDRRSGS